ncbi:hypothetical protein DPMN_147921 [Dreissena polymorpha]|uniref:Uncharacterized protein n=1 Tax=Dreissena polymorpha TaxID=45954 RepID=A0A9D4J3F9_DREPO|nr:hypothetical protein DPMN_147921 [Dreissena polymorpha]
MTALCVREHSKRLHLWVYDNTSIGDTTGCTETYKAFTPMCVREHTKRLHLLVYGNGPGGRDGMKSEVHLQRGDCQHQSV